MTDSRLGVEEKKPLNGFAIRALFGGLMLGYVALMAS
jgi:hypothetical protein